MSLSVQPIYDDMVRQSSTSLASTRFQNDFIDSFNDMLDDLYAYGALATPIGHIAAYDESVADLEEHEKSFIVPGIMFYLIRRDQRHSGMGLKDAMAFWEDAKANFLMVVSRDLQAEVDDDGIPTADVVGLGYIENTTSSETI